LKHLKKIQYNAPVTLTFALVSLAALGLGYLTDSKSTLLVFSVYRSPINDPLMYIRLFAHVAGHANLTHYFNNFLIILLVGPMLEEKYGSRTVLFMILLAAVVTGVINMAFFNKILLGASGVVFMFILLSSFVNLKTGRLPVTFILVLVIFIGREVLEGITLTDNVSQLSHVAGGLCGAMLGFYLNRDVLFKIKANETPVDIPEATETDKL